MQEKELLEEETILQAKPIEETPSYQDGELFQHYEINRFQLTPYFYKIAGASVVLNAVFALAMTQFNLAQNKACDSVYVSKVCSVIDAVYVGSQFFGTKSTTVDEPYDQTKFDTEDIAWFDVSNKELFQYPEGYFYKEEEQQPQPPANEFGLVNGGDSAKTSNPNAFKAPGEGLFNTTPSNPTTTTPSTTNPIAGNPTTGSSLDINKPAVLPKRGKVKDDFPTSVTGGNPIAKGKSDLKIISKASKNPLMKDDPGKLPDDNDIAGNDKSKQPTSDKTAGKNQSESKKKSELDITDFNEQPLKDYREEAKKILKSGVDSNSTFEVTMKGVLSKNGKLDPKQSKWGRDTIGDPKLVDLVKKGITALNDSGYLQYLSKLNAKELYFNAVQKDGNVSAKVIASVGNEVDARRISSAFGVFISLGISAKQKSIEAEKDSDKKQNAMDELFLLQKASVTSQGNNIILSFDMPSDVAKEFVERKINQGQNNSANARPQSSNLNTNQSSSVEKSK